MGVKELRRLATCDVDNKHLGGEPDNKTAYTDCRRVIERKDIDVVSIATPPHWHALISIAAAQAGKDILCEKPMTRFIAEGRAVVDAVKRYGRVFQIGTCGRFGAVEEQHQLADPQDHAQRAAEGLPRRVHPAAAASRCRSIAARSTCSRSPCPKTLDWDMYCGPVAAAALPPAPLRLEPPLLLGLRRRRPGRLRPALHGPVPVDLRQGRHQPGRDRGPMPRAGSIPTPAACGAGSN